MLIRTTLNIARGRELRVIKHGQRVEQRLPPSAAEILKREMAQAEYLLETAATYSANGLFKHAAESLVHAISISCRHRWLAVSKKQDTPPVDSFWLLEKLRCCHFLERSEYRTIVRLLNGRLPTDIFEAEDYCAAASKVVNY